MKMHKELKPYRVEIIVEGDLSVPKDEKKMKRYEENLFDIISEACESYGGKCISVNLYRILKEEGK